MKIAIIDMLSTRSIARDLTLGLIPVIIIVSSIMGSTNYYITSNREVRILHQQADEIAENLARILAYSIYMRNQREIQLIGQEFERGINVGSVSIFDEIINAVYRYDDRCAVFKE